MRLSGRSAQPLYFNQYLGEPAIRERILDQTLNRLQSGEPQRLLEADMILLLAGSWGEATKAARETSAMNRR